MIAGLFIGCIISFHGLHSLRLRLLLQCTHLKSKPSCVGELVRSNATFIATLRCSSHSSMAAVSSLFSFFPSFFPSAIPPPILYIIYSIPLVLLRVLNYCMFSHLLEVPISGAQFISRSANATHLGLATHVSVPRS